jgi:hypothetical protein
MPKKAAFFGGQFFLLGNIILEIAALKFPIK